MMKKTILTLTLALSIAGVVSAHEGTEAVAAKAEAAETKATTSVVSEPKGVITPQALGMDMTRHYAQNIPQGGTPKSAQAVGVVKN